MQKNQDIKAFTLVELAIVLIIIALLAAGVLAGQDVISATKRNKIITEVNTIKTAMGNFKAKYFNNLPGDFDEAEKFWTNTLATNGDGDGIIDKTRNSMGETLLVWQHLSLAQMLPGNYNGAAVGGDYQPETNIPSTDYSKAGGYVFYNRQLGGTDDVYNKTGNVLELGKCGNHPNTDIFCFAPILKAADAKAIDEKMDDGIADSGELFSSNGRDANGTVTGCAGTWSDASGSYVLNSTNLACRLFFWIEGNEDV